MAATALTATKAAIAEVIAALGPSVRPSYHPSRYVRAQKAPGPGVSAHRQFWFSAPTGGGIREQGVRVLRLEHTFELLLSLNLAAYSTEERGTIVYEEAVALINAIHATPPVPNAHAPRALSYVPLILDGRDEDVTLSIAIRVRTREEGLTL